MSNKAHESGKLYRVPVLLVVASSSSSDSRNILLGLGRRHADDGSCGDHTDDTVMDMLCANYHFAKTRRVLVIEVSICYPVLFSARVVLFDVSFRSRAKASPSTG